MSENFVHFVGNLVADPTLRGTEDKPRATLTIAVNEKRNDEEVVHYVNVTAFGTLSRNVCKSLKKGQRIVVEGRIGSFKKAVVIDGENKELTMLSVTASSIGPDLRFATASVTKVKSGSSGKSEDEPSGAAEGGKSSGESKKASAAAAKASDNEEDF